MGSDRVFSHAIEVRFRDCDPMGHVNHAVFLTYLEQARFAYWRAVSHNTPGPGAGIIIARVECDFRAPILMGDPIDVRLWVSEIGRSSFMLDYEIVRLTDERVVATARTVIVAYDYSAGRSVPIPDDMRARLEQARLTPAGR
ncbi:MAG TPA: thioesterase family protein [Vicinamibacterales bacterium]|jgi:acyl-CoA thioester hydrolase